MRRFRLTTRPFQPTLALLAALGALLLVATIYIDVRDTSGGGQRMVWLYLALVVVALLAGFLAREVSARTRTDRALAVATAAISELNDPRDSTTSRTVPEVLDDLIDRIRSVLRAEWAFVALTDEGDESGVLRVTSTAGDAPHSRGERLEGTDVPSDTTSDRLAVPLAFGSDQLGLVEIGGAPGRSFKRSDHDLLRLLADRLAALAEQARLADRGRRSALGIAQARAHLALIAEISIVLARALEDTRPALEEVCDILVHNFADACAIHLTRQGADFDLVSGQGRSPRAADLFTPPEGASVGPEVVALRRVLASGRSELSFVMTDDRVFGSDDPLAQKMRAAGMASWVVAPIKLRGLPLGTLTVATGRNRRGFRPSDHAIVDEIASRLAIAIERGVLYADARAASVAAEKRADQLSNLIEAAIALTRSLQPNDVLSALVEQATRLLDAGQARAWLGDDSGLEATFGEANRDPLWISGRLTDHTGTPMGAVTVERSSNRPFETDEEALLVLVGRFASAALQNARLYDDVRLREQRLGALFAASPLAILEFDLGGAVRDANPAARRLFDASSIRDLALPAELLHTIAELRGHALEGETSDTQVSLNTEDGRLELWISAAPLRRGTGALAGMLVVISDMTERKRLEEQLLEAHRFEAIAQLAGGVAHDFNNLLTIIVGYSDLLMHSQPDNEEITAIHEAGRHAAVITNQLLTLSRRQVVQPVTVPIGRACQSLNNMLTRLAGNRVTVVLHCDSDAAIRIDAGQLEQVLFNLVLNSRDASPSGGRVTVRTSEREGDLGTPEVALSVTDQGHGMDADTVARCREPFFTTKGRRGIGLGLATVQSIVQRAGGRLEIDSEVGLGTTITAVFPRVDAARVPVTPGARREQAKVLLVDDDELIRRYASQVLLDAGFDVTTAGSGEAAVEMMSANGGFDLLISDVVMPGMNGFELARRAGDQYPTLARLLITGYAGTDTAGTDLEDIAVLTKPFAGDDLVRAANDALA